MKLFTNLPRLDLTQTTQSLTALLALGTLALSFQNLQTFSGSHGIPAGLNWLWAISIDLAILIFGLARISDRLKGRNAGLNTAFFWIATVASIGANIADSAMAHKWLSVATHATPPLFLCGCVESLLQRLERDLNAPHKGDSISPIGKTISTEKQAQITELHKQGITQREIARRVEVSVPTVSKWIKNKG